MVYLNGAFKINISKGTQTYNGSGLIPGALYTISTRTIDIAGNINTTWVNHSARTIPDMSIPASISNLKNVSYAP
jgi:hypothetical protein